MKRGEVWWITNDGATGCEQFGRRPAIIVSNNACNAYSPTIQMIPLTASRKKPMPTHVRFPLNGRMSTALCEQICCVDKGRVDRYAGELDEETMRQVEKAMRIQLGMEAFG